MAKWTQCLLDGNILDIAEALKLRSHKESLGLPHPDFRCLGCQEKVRAHNAGSTGQCAHFEHSAKNPGCQPETVNRVNTFVSPKLPYSCDTSFTQSGKSKPAPIRNSAMTQFAVTPDLSKLSQFLPLQTGYWDLKPTLCIGLDIAWHGGSKNNLDSQYDCIVAALIKPDNSKPLSEIVRVQLVDRDPDAKLTTQAIKALLVKYSGLVNRVVIGIDAPLQTVQVIPPDRQKARRAVDSILDENRKAIDKALGRSNGWHPVIQPGAPLAPRVLALLENMLKQGFSIWNLSESKNANLIIETFPSEAIWALKRQGSYQDHLTSTDVKFYKKLGGQTINAAEVQELVLRVLAPLGGQVGLPSEWNHILSKLIDWILTERIGRIGSSYRGGKLFDDVIDSTLCLGAALGYANGKAHCWRSSVSPDDGHIIGPGVFP